MLGYRYMLDSSVRRRVRHLVIHIAKGSVQNAHSTPDSVYYLYALIRRPRLILDFALTLLFNHLVLTTYYSAAIPTSIFFWAIMGIGTTLTVVFAEQACVRREMTEGLVVASAPPDGDDNMEMGSLLRQD